MPSWLAVLQGLLTPVIAGTAAYIAWQQWKTNQRKLHLDMYERRLRSYQAVVGFLTLVLRDFKPEISEVIGFRAATAEADFLFGPEIRSYIHEVANHALHLRKAHFEYRDATQPIPPDYDHSAVVAEMAQNEAWFALQHDVAKEKFMGYLSVNREDGIVPWKRLAVIGVAAGVGFAMAGLVILQVWSWFASRPVPWSASGLSVVSSESVPTYEIRSGTLRLAGFALRFAIQNASSRDVTIPTTVTVMKRLSDGGVLVEYSSVARPYAAGFLPAGQRTQFEVNLDVGCRQWDEKGVESERPSDECYKDVLSDTEAFVLFSSTDRLQLVLPKPALRLKREAPPK